MRILIAAIIGILAFNGYGQPIQSKTNLEGWGKDGIQIEIHDFSRVDRTFNMKAISNQVEIKLRRAGFQIAKGFATDKIYVNCGPIVTGNGVTGYSLRIQAERVMTFNNNGIQYFSFASGKWYGGIIPNALLRNRIDVYMDALLLDYLKANPKK